MTDVINVEQINAVHLKVTADGCEREEIAEYFSFKPAEYKYIPAYKIRM